MAWPARRSSARTGPPPWRRSRIGTPASARASRWTSTPSPWDGRTASRTRSSARPRPAEPMRSCCSTGSETAQCWLQPAHGAWRSSCGPPKTARRTSRSWTVPRTASCQTSSRSATAPSFHTPYPEIADLIARITCPNRANTTHVLINPIAARALCERRAVEGVVIPDGFDFDRDVTPIDEATFRGRLEVLSGNRTPVTPDDLVVAMPARVAINKAIELAIQFVAGLEGRRAELEDAPGGLGASGRRFTRAGKVVLLLP